SDPAFCRGFFRTSIADYPSVLKVTGSGPGEDSPCGSSLSKHSYQEAISSDAVVVNIFASQSFVRKRRQIPGSFCPSIEPLDSFLRGQPFLHFLFAVYLIQSLAQNVIQ